MDAGVAAAAATAAVAIAVDIPFFVDVFFLFLSFIVVCSYR